MFWTLPSLSLSGWHLGPSSRPWSTTYSCRPIGLVLGGLDFKDYFIALKATDLHTYDEVKKAGVPVIAYGQFLTTVLNFLIVAFCVFLVVKQINRFNKPAVADAPSTKDCPFCMSSISAKAIKCPHCTSSLKAVGRSTL